MSPLVANSIPIEVDTHFSSRDMIGPRISTFRGKNIQTLPGFETGSPGVEYGTYTRQRKLQEKGKSQDCTFKYIYK